MFLPTAWDTTELYATFFPVWPSPTVPGNQQRRAVCRATPPAHPSEKSALGGGWGEGGALVRQPRGPPSPRNQPRPPPCPHLRKRQRIFILMRWPGDYMAYGHVPRPGAENARHGARARVPPCSDQGAMQTGERCPHVCPGPFFTISPLQPSSRGYYELYQGRCLEISCGAPPR